MRATSTASPGSRCTTSPNRGAGLGFGRPAQVAPVRGNPMFSQDLEDSCAAYDPDQANALLDAMGLEWDANNESVCAPTASG